ncbi:hypothetical protein GCM10020256_29350 [Streptomyces thermocoprophilus]
MPSPARISPGSITRRYAPVRPRRVNRFTQPGTPQMPLEGPAGDTPRGHLEHHRAADPPALADQCPGHVQALGGEVLPEGAVAQRAAQLALPLVEVLARERVHRLVVAAVMPGVAHRVPGHPARPDALGAGRRHPQRAVRGAFVDAGQALRLIRVGDGPGLADVHREKLHARTVGERYSKCRRNISHISQGSLMIEG